ncbi:MAG: hypothetical protein IJ566_01340 [Cardiobacteriaceae bacterium]|nr:hypothetical protein [Cardiobacteriaceae bacterium]
MQKIYKRSLYGKIICLIKLLIWNAIIGFILTAFVALPLISEETEKAFGDIKSFREFADKLPEVINLNIAFELFWPVLICLIFIIYFFADYCHRKLVINENGVYQEGGFMPWNNGYIGVDWEFLESAYFYQSFFNWLVQDYPIELKRRFTDENTRFFISHIAKAKNAVADINDVVKLRHSPHGTEQTQNNPPNVPLVSS